MSILGMLAGKVTVVSVVSPKGTYPHIDLDEKSSAALQQSQLGLFLGLYVNAHLMSTEGEQELERVFETVGDEREAFYRVVCTALTPTFPILGLDQNMILTALRRHFDERLPAPELTAMFELAKKLYSRGVRLRGRMSSGATISKEPTPIKPPRSDERWETFREKLRQHGPCKNLNKYLKELNERAFIEQYDAHVYHDRAYLYVVLEDNWGAIADLSFLIMTAKGISLIPENIYRLLRALLYFEECCSKQAVEDIASVLVNDSENLHALALLSLIHEQLPEEKMPTLSKELSASVNEFLNIVGSVYQMKHTLLSLYTCS